MNADLAAAVARLREREGYGASPPPPCFEKRRPVDDSLCARIGEHEMCLGCRHSDLRVPEFRAMEVKP